MMLVATFALNWNWFPATGAPLVGRPPGAVWHAALPSVALAAGGDRGGRAPAAQRADRDPVLAIRAHAARQGPVAGGAILWRHGLKNVAVTLLTVIGLLFSRLLGATVVIEAVFAIPGIGSMVVRAAIVKDFPVVQGVVLTMVIIVIALNLLIDVLYTVVDPRVA